MSIQIIQKFAVFCDKLLSQKVRVAAATSLLTLCVSHNAYSAAPSQDPLFLSNPVTPIMMLNMSKDHQLYFKVYDDYSDLDGDKIPDTTYKKTYEYYGYFDSKKCYIYSTTNNRFEPIVNATSDHYCNTPPVTNQWSGNFLNWASMTRMDSVRKILYGGLRSTDSATDTVLERAFLPSDAHSFAKFYDDTDIGFLTPFGSVPKKQSNTTATGITICNTTPGGTALSQNVTNAPLLRVAKGNYTFWASNERWQCRWNSAGNDANGNQSAITNVYAGSNNPVDTLKLGTGSAAGEYYARVQVCVAGMEEDNCYQYPSGNKKPQGLLQEFGEIREGSTVAKINFGLMTGSYSKNKAGGILRKAVGNLSDEVNATTNGTFITGAAGAITTLNKLRIYGYRYADGTYFGETGSDDCSWALGSFSTGCSNWGNPQAEIYLESLRYLAGKTANSNFSASDSSKISSLPVASWVTKPITSANYCAPLSVLQFNTSSTSYDGDDLSTASDIMGSESLNTWTNKVGGTDYEKLSGNYFVGKIMGSSLPTDTNELCTAKAIGNLSDVRGTCPDAPRLEGSYQIAGLASYVRRNDLIPPTPPVAPSTTYKRNSQAVRTYGVALAPALPKVIIPVPGSTTGNAITILPACRNKTITTSSGQGANCAIVDFKILAQASTGNTAADKNTGTFYVNWEDSEQGGDYDQDLWGIIKYEVTATKVKITTDAVAQSSGDLMGFGFVVNGTGSVNGISTDGFHVLSGINGFTFDGCNNCLVGDSEKSVTYDVGTGTSNAKLLESPLFYAAKWGGYSDDYFKTLKNAKEKISGPGSFTDTDLQNALRPITSPSSYYFATDPRALEDSLRNAFRDVAKGIGSASAVATNSTSLNEGAYIYQARFNSENWSGTLNAFAFDDEGEISKTPAFSTDDSTSMSKTATGRNIYTYNGSANVSFSWANLTTAQQAALQLSTESSNTMAQKRVSWLLGSATDEGAGGLRDRGDGDKRVILGDIVNSSPAYIGAWDFRYQVLPTIGSTYKAYVEEKKKKMPRVLVGSNDGMVHIFQAPTSQVKTFKELYGYIPGIAFPKLAKITQPNYGSKENPHQFIVDGSLTMGDVYLNSQWRTIVVGTLGAGGRGVYALDVTDDTTAPKVLFELNEVDYPKLGYVLGKPLIVPMKNGRWAAIFGNGSGSGANSSLFVVDIEKPKDTNYTKIIDVGTGTGLSSPALLANGFGQVETAYAGDLNGNLWRFDLSNAAPANWKKDYLLFAAKDNSNNVQPITAAPTIGVNSKKTNMIMVYFGTGKYFDVGDNSNGTTPVHSFYAIADVGASAAPVLRSSLFSKLFTTTYSSTTNSRVINVAQPNWTTQNGWYMDFSDTSGERVTTKAILLQDKLVFPTLIPSGIACEYGGKSWLMEVVAVGNKYPTSHMLDDPLIPGGPGGSGTSDGILESYLILGNLGFGQTPNKKTNTQPDCDPGAIVGSGTDSTLLKVNNCSSKLPTGRQSWRQLR